MEADLRRSEWLQELDTEFLILWDGFPDPSKPWEYRDGTGLLEFLLKRIDEGYSFPLNPVWPVRDKGWYTVFEALRQRVDSEGPFEAAFPPGSDILERVD